MNALPEQPSHDYIGVAPCGCTLAIVADMGDKWTAGEVADLIKGSYTVERLPLAEAVARLTERRDCRKHKPEPKQAMLAL